MLLHKLITLPSLVPFVTTHHFPDLLRFGAFFGLNLLFGWNKNEFGGDYNLYGWLTIANGGLALLMGARNNLFAVAARIPSTTLLMYHRWSGRATVIHATIHFGFNIRRYIDTNQAATVLENRRIQVGLMAWIALCLILISSVSIIRRKTFELFYYPHFLFLVFVVGAIYHASHGLEFILPGLILWGLDRLIRFCYAFRAVRITSLTHYPGDLTKIRFDGMRTTAAGQIAWVHLKGVSLFHWHPFTIASAPSKDGVIAIRGLGGYTRRLYTLATQQKQPESETYDINVASSSKLKMRLDGPYGVGHIQWGRFPVTVLVAGGIGITPGISIATHIIETAALSKAQVGGQAQWHIHLLWILRDSRHVQWFEEELKHIASTASDPSVPATLEISIHVTGSSDGAGEHKYSGPGTLVQGRPDLVDYFEYIRRQRPGLDAAVNACGPRKLIDGVRRAAAKASCEEGVFRVEEEVFER